MYLVVYCFITFNCMAVMRKGHLVFIALLHLIILLMSIDIQYKLFAHRLVFIGLFSCDFPLDTSDSTKIFSILSLVGY